jgi:F-type H+-transporting ATPase subunit epsilon
VIQLDDLIEADMANTLRLEIVTPEATVYSQDIDMVTLPAVNGQIGVLPQHVRLMTQLVPGELIVRQGGRDEFLAVGEGLVEVTNDRVSIVTNMAVAVESIDEAAAEEARQRAAARLKEKLSSEEIASVNASLARSLAQLNVKRRHR